MKTIFQYVDEIEPEINAVREDIHRHPELGLQEFRTSALIEKELRQKTTEDSIRKVGETGWLVEIKGTKPGPKHCIALRGDMDALPVQESEDFALRSEINNVMHACGHDVHTSILLGAVRVLEHYRDQIAGSVLFFFQPAEEIMKGAKLFADNPMIDFDEIDGVAALHVSPELDAGTIGTRYGAILGSSDELTITLRGKGGHGAHPHTVIDPVAAAAEIINVLQTLVSREVTPHEPAVVSICSIHSDGNAFNIIPNQVELCGTIRAVKPEIRDLLVKRIPEIVMRTAEGMRVTAEVSVKLGPPPFVNDKEWVDRVFRSSKKLLGPEYVAELPIPSMGAEDFAFVKEKAPGVFVRFGARTPGGPYGSMHSPTFYCDRKAIRTGILTLCGIALDFFEVEY